MTNKLSNPRFPQNTQNTKLNLMKNDPDFLIANCNGNTDISGDSSGVDYFFNQKSPYNYPKLIICDDSKRINQNADIYLNYSDVIIDSCGNRFNIRNLKDSAGILQVGYSKNIDLDSHLKNINFYNDKCFYDNWKLEPKSILDDCNGLKWNSKILVPDYTPVGRHYGDCIGSGECAQKDSATCYNTPPTDLNCETNIRKRYDFSHNTFQTESCIKPADWVSFKKEPVTGIYNLDNYPDTQRSLDLLNTINSGYKYDYYKFFEDSKCINNPAQRLFNNNTSRKSTPNHHNIYNIQPKYLS